MRQLGSQRSLFSCERRRAACYRSTERQGAYNVVREAKLCLIDALSCEVFLVIIVLCLHLVHQRVALLRASAQCVIHQQLARH